MTMDKIDLKLYVVRNKEGQYFHAKGRSSYGKTWVDDIQNARIYAKIGPARSIVSYFAKHYPKYGFPEIYELSIDSMTLKNETERVKKVLKKDAEEKLANELRNKKYEIELAEKQIKAAQEKLNQLRSSV